MFLRQILTRSDSSNLTYTQIKVILCCLSLKFNTYLSIYIQCLSTVWKHCLIQRNGKVCPASSLPEKLSVIIQWVVLDNILMKSYKDVGSDVYSLSGLGLRLWELCRSLEETRADSDFPSFKVKEFFLWVS